MGTKIIVTYVLTCDEPDCLTEIGPTDDLGRLVAGARAIGWRVDYVTAMARNDVALALCRRHNPIPGEPGQDVTNDDLAR